jgi:hypothetical protein
MQMKISRQKPPQDSHIVGKSEGHSRRWQKHMNKADAISRKLSNASSRLVTIRLITFILLVTLLVAPDDRQLYFGIFGELLVVLVTLAFGYQVYRHQQIQKRKKYFDYVRDHHHSALKRLDREWPLLNTLDLTLKTGGDNFKDLGVTGEQASLAKLFGMITCPDAWQNWLNWLNTPADDNTIKTRQRAVQTLRDKRPTLLRFIYAASHDNPSEFERDELKQWLGSEKTDKAMNLVFFISIVAVLLLWVGLIGSVFHWLPLWVGITGGVLNGLITLLTFGKTDQLFKKTEGLSPVINSMQSRIAVIKNTHFDDEHLQSLQRPLVTTQNNAIKSLGTISKLSMLADLRHFGLIYLLAQITLLWNIHIYTGITCWHRKHRKHILHSYECLSELETLCGVACFALENNTFSYPQQSSDQKSSALQIKLKQIGHPLLPFDQRINNDLQWTDEKPMLLISGSNMAGKSTFMKALGLNVLLSRLGAPVCASSATWPKMTVKTVIKVEDSLANGDSYFMAELKRLVNITKGSQNQTENESEPLFTLCLFDEIMSGTNSHDRTEIFKAIVATLQHQTFAVFSTHDMQLADYAKDHQRFDLYQFSETYRPDPRQGKEGGNEEGKEHYTMHFDYQLKPGICQQTNAQTLLKVLGLNG